MTTKEQRDAYNHSPKGRAARARYRASAKGKALPRNRAVADAAYYQRNKGRKILQARTRQTLHPQTWYARFNGDAPARREAALAMGSALWVLVTRAVPSKWSADDRQDAISELAWALLDGIIAPAQLDEAVRVYRTSTFYGARARPISIDTEIGRGRTIADTLVAGESYA